LSRAAVDALCVLQEMNNPYQRLEAIPLWRIISDALSDLVTNQDITITTNEDYVVGYLI